MCLFHWRFVWLRKNTHTEVDFLMLFFTVFSYILESELRAFVTPYQAPKVDVLYVYELSVESVEKRTQYDNLPDHKSSYRITLT